MVTKKDFVNKIYTAAKAAGLSDAAARVMAAQGAIESSYGANAPGNNLFGMIKGPDWNGPTIPRNDNGHLRDFRSYPSVEAGIADRVAMMGKQFPDFNSAPTMNAALDALRNGKLGKYYEAPQHQYESAVQGINEKYLGGDAPAPTPPTNVPASGISNADSAKAYLRTKAINATAEASVAGMNNSYAIALASGMQAAEKATGDTSLKLLTGERDPKTEAQLYANYKGQPYSYGGKTYEPAKLGVSSGFKATPPNMSGHAYGLAADVSGGSNPTVTVTGPAITWLTAHRADFGLANGSADLGIDDPAHFQVPQSVLRSVMVAAGGAIPGANSLDLSAWTNAPKTLSNSALNAIDTATGGPAKGPSTADGVAGQQRALAKAGFDPGPIDGNKGPRTLAAIKSFQKANGLTPDGVVGPLTSAKLVEVGGTAPGTFRPTH